MQPGFLLIKNNLQENLNTVNGHIIIFNGRLTGFVWKCSIPCKLGLLFVLKCKQLCWFIKGVLEALSFLFVLHFSRFCHELLPHPICLGTAWPEVSITTLNVKALKPLWKILFPSQHCHSFCSWLTWFKKFLPSNWIQSRAPYRATCFSSLLCRCDSRVQQQTFLN